MRSGNYEIELSDGSKALRQLVLVRTDNDENNKVFVNLPELGENGIIDTKTGICKKENGEFWFKVIASK